MRFNPRGNGAAHSSLSSYKILRRGDIAFEGNRHRSHPFGQLVINDIGDGLMSSRFQSIRPKEPCVISFWKYLLQNERDMRRLLICSTKAGTLMNEFVFDDFSRLDVQLPERDEQEKIGALFRLLDSIIAAEKRKLQLIEMKKRLLLQRILNGKMRFMGFCDSWIQLKLDDAICVCSGKDYKHLSKGNIPVYGTGGYMTSVSKALSNRDAIGIGRKGTIDKPYVLHAPFWTVDTLFYALPRNGYDLNFLFAVFQNINWKSKNESTGLPSLSKKNIENTSIITPSIDEQYRIGELFSLFDSILDETNQKIRLLEKKRKALLRDMFV
ncbi:type I restriction endonuclease subunit S [Bifidobacterium criceti]|uniref:Type I restriction endonuclease subunit S n=2 Tax=Bifidobacterium criceti TaxID=1960969 RepID=A0A2A2EEU9_9BIFI|nr:type I restriction endonuclease subunit S [Bifidobacterium criceti]